MGLLNFPFEDAFIFGVDGLSEAEVEVEDAEVAGFDSVLFASLTTCKGARVGDVKMVSGVSEFETPKK